MKNKEPIAKIQENLEIVVSEEAYKKLLEELSRPARFHKNLGELFGTKFGTKM